VEQEVRSAYADAETAMRQVAFLRDELLPEAQDAYRIASTSYSLGGSSALEVLDAKRVLLDAQSQYADALGAANDAVARLELAVGASPSTPAAGTDHDE
jgi:cobalt-zinc-cadmium efflux system outer membrane protein